MSKKRLSGVVKKTSASAKANFRKGGETDAFLRAILPRENEMVGRMRDFDWSQTPVGPVESWPQSLKTAVRIVLNSRYPMFVWWGRDLTNIYNDAYRPMLGARHPQALGQSAARVWADVWPVVGPQTEMVLNEGRSTWNESVLLVMTRYGFTEEAYFTFSYSPVPDDAGGVGGVFCAVTEDTKRVLGERRLKTLRALGECSLAETKTAEQACYAAAATLAENLHDFPFALIYLLDEDSQQARLCEAVNLAAGAIANPEAVAIDSDEDVWNFRRVLETKQSQIVENLEVRFGRLPAGPWADDWTKRALVLPLAKAGVQDLPAGFLVAGLSPRLAFADDYRSFLELAAGQLAMAIANARAYDEERKRAEALAALDRAKTAFFSNVSHEFRTPLTLMLGPLEEALANAHGVLPPGAAEDLALSHRNALRLLKLVNTLLDFSRIEAGRIRASYHLTDLSALTVELASNFRSACEKAGLQLVVDCPPFSGGEPVYVDRDMWEKIVLNLVSNAFKFTMKGEIEVRLQAIDGQAQLTVRDTGVGIPSEELPRMFERFHRIEQSRGRTHEGTGIGLALVHELVRLHGGAARVDSVFGEGSVFTVTIPFGKAHLDPECVGKASELASTEITSSAFEEEALRWLPEDDSRHSGEPTFAPALAGSDRDLPDIQPEGRRARILWADDNTDMHEYVSRLLGGRCDVQAISDGQAALEAARANPPDLVLSDVMMPRLDGFGLLREMRADPKLREIPIVLLSARAGEESRVEGMEAGADDYLIKPFSARELVARVETHVKMSRLRREAERRLAAELAATQALQEISTRMIYEGDIGSLYEQVLDAAMAVMQSDMASMQVVDEGEDALRMLAFRGFGPEFGRVFELNRRDRKTTCNAARRVGHRVIVADVGTCDFIVGTPSLEAYRKAGIRAVQSTPLISRSGRLLGMISTYWRRPHQPSERDLRLLDVLARQAADLLERKQADELLRESEQRFRTLADDAPVLIWLNSPTGCEFANRKYLEFLGVGEAEVLGDKWAEFVHPQDREAYVNAYREAVSGRVRFEAEFRFRRRDGEYRWMHSVGMPRFEGGEFKGYVGSAFDIHDRKLAEAVIAQMAAIVESSDDSIIGTDSNAIITSWNEGAEKLLGYTAAEIIGKPVTILIPSEREDEESYILELIRRGESVDHYETVRRGKDGGEIDISLTVSPIRDKSGKVIGASKIARDISERKRIEIEREELLRRESEARGEAEKTNRIKDEFLATVSHELRTPLNAMLGWLQMLRWGNLEEAEVAPALEAIERNAKAQNRLVDDLLDTSRISMGKLQFEQSPVELIPVIEAALEAVRPSAEAKGVELRLELDPTAGLVLGDATRLQQIVWNLLSNAIKYTPQGEYVETRLERDGASAAIIVRDTGEGISPEFLPHVFAPFRQADASMTRRHGGLGIGLTIVRHLVEAHGGQVSASTEGAGQGATFKVVLPLTTSADTGPKEKDKDAAEQSALLTGLRALLVDDNLDTRMLLSMALNKHGAEVRAGATVREALEILEQWQPDVLVSDIGMPGEDGYDLIRQVRSLPDERGGNIPAVAVTGFASTKDAARAIAAGYQMFVTKPIDLGELMALIRSLTQHFGMGQNS